MKRVFASLVVLGACVPAPPPQQPVVYAPPQQQEPQPPPAEPVQPAPAPEPAPVPPPRPPIDSDQTYIYPVSPPTRPPVVQPPANPNGIPAANARIWTPYQGKPKTGNQSTGLTIFPAKIAAVRCNGNQRISIQRKVIKESGIPAVIAEGNCKVDIADSALLNYGTGPVVVVKNNASVTIRRSDIAGNIRVAHQGKLHLRRNSIEGQAWQFVRGTRITEDNNNLWAGVVQPAQPPANPNGIPGANARVWTPYQGKAKTGNKTTGLKVGVAKRAVVRCKGNRKITIKQKGIHTSGQPAVIAGGNCKVDIVDSRLVNNGAGPVVIVKDNASVNIRRSNVNGNIRVAHKGKLHLRRSRMNGKAWKFITHASITEDNNNLWAGVVQPVKPPANPNGIPGANARVWTPYQGKAKTGNKTTGLKVGVAKKPAIRCKGNRKITIKQKGIHTNGQPAVIAGGNCKVDIVDSRLINNGAGPVVIVKDNASVNIRRSNVNGNIRVAHKGKLHLRRSRMNGKAWKFITHASITEDNNNLWVGVGQPPSPQVPETSIPPANARVWARYKGKRKSGKKPAGLHLGVAKRPVLRCAGNKRITIKRQSIHTLGSPAIIAGGNCQVDVVNSRLANKGAGPVIIVKDNASVTIRRSNVNGNIRVAHQGKLQLRRSRIKGKAWKFITGASITEDGNNVWTK